MTKLREALICADYGLIKPKLKQFASRREAVNFRMYFYHMRNELQEVGDTKYDGLNVSLYGTTVVFTTWRKKELIQWVWKNAYFSWLLSL